MYTHTGSQKTPGIYLSPPPTALDIITHSFYRGAGDSNSSPISPLSQQVPDPFSHLLSLKLAFLNICLQPHSTVTFQEKPEGGLRPQMYQKTRLQHLLNFGAHLVKRFSLCVYTHVYMHTHVIQHMWRSEDIMTDSVLFHRMGPRTGTQVIRLGGWQRYF